MNKTNYYRVVLVCTVIGAFFITLFYMSFNVSLDTQEPKKPKTYAEVVDTYRGCDIIRWTNHQLADYKYFMDCNHGTL